MSAPATHRSPSAAPPESTQALRARYFPRTQSLARPSRTELEAAFTRAGNILLGHAIFVTAGVCAVWLLRRLLHLPSQTVSVVVLAGFVCFFLDILRWMRLREALRSTSR